MGHPYCPPQGFKSRKHTSEQTLSGRLLLGERPAFLVAKTTHDVIVNQTGRLHMRIHDGAADEFEPTLLQVLAQHIRFS